MYQRLGDGLRRFLVGLVLHIWWGLDLVDLVELALVDLVDLTVLRFGGVGGWIWWRRTAAYRYGI